MNTPLLCLLGALAVWRATHLLHAETGPAGVFERLRARAGNGLLGAVLGCFYCLSLWTALPVALAVGGNALERVLLWPALSAVAILLEHRGRLLEDLTVAAQYFEDPPPADADAAHLHAPRAGTDGARLTH